MGQWLDKLHPFSVLHQENIASSAQAKQTDWTQRMINKQSSIHTLGELLPLLGMFFQPLPFTHMHACMQFLDGWQQAARLLQTPLRLLRMTPDTAWGCQSTLTEWLLCARACTGARAAKMAQNQFFCIKHFPSSQRRPHRRCHSDTEQLIPRNLDDRWCQQPKLFTLCA